MLNIKCSGKERKKDLAKMSKEKKIQVRKFLAVTIAVMMLVTAMPLPASAGVGTKYDEYAAKLSELKVFVGTGNGFELDREPTRLEGLVMLIRLLGAEDQAKARTNYTLKFDDVLAWGKPYVQYAYENGLTLGISSTKFGSLQALDSKSYVTFLLRALGYSDKNGDFSWNLANDFGKEIGLINSGMHTELTSGAFLRDHVAKTSYDALNMKVKGGEVSLADKLIEQGSIQDSVAEKVFSGIPPAINPTSEIDFSQRFKLSPTRENNHIYLQWEDVGADYYRVYYSKDKDSGENTLYKDANGQTRFPRLDGKYSVQLPDYFDHQIYYFVVTAVKDNKEYRISQPLAAKGSIELFDADYYTKRLKSHYPTISLNDNVFKMQNIIVVKEQGYLLVDFLITDIDGYKAVEKAGRDKVIEGLSKYSKEIMELYNGPVLLSLIYTNISVQKPSGFEKETNHIMITRFPGTETIYVHKVGNAFGGYIIYFPLVELYHIDLPVEKINTMFWSD